MLYSGKKRLLTVHQKMFFFNMKRAGKAFSCPQLYIRLLIDKITVPLGENSSKRNYLLMAIVV